MIGRSLLVPAGLSIATACAPHPTTVQVADPDPITVAGRAEQAPEQGPPVSAPVTPLAPPTVMEEIADLDDEARWAWAIARMPALAEHKGLDSGAGNPALADWFQADRVFIRTSAECFEVQEGRWTGDAFVGRAHRRVRIEGDTKHVSWLAIEIAPGGIVETGPHGESFTRDARGRWTPSGGFGTGCADVIVPRSVSEVTEDALYFAGYDYTLTIECTGTERLEQTCRDGTTRVCERCAGLWAQRHAHAMGWGRGHAARRGRDSRPVDCSVPCPTDTATPLIEPLNAIVKGRRFVDTTEVAGAVYRSRRACQRDPRWRSKGDAED